MFSQNFSPSGPPFQSGTYVPTLTAVANITSFALGGGGYWTYFNIGNIVIVAGQIGIQATAIGVAQLNVSLPISSSITLASIDINGNMTSPTSGTVIGSVVGVVSKTIAQLFIYAANTSNNGFRVFFMYRLS